LWRLSYRRPLDEQPLLICGEVEEVLNFRDKYMSTSRRAFLGRKGQRGKKTVGQQAADKGVCANCCPEHTPTKQAQARPLGIEMKRSRRYQEGPKGMPLLHPDSLEPGIAQK
jgi:hypothetical protein